MIDDEPEQNDELTEKKVRTGRGKIQFAHLYCFILGSIISDSKKVGGEEECLMRSDLKLL